MFKGIIKKVKYVMMIRRLRALYPKAANLKPVNNLAMFVRYNKINDTWEQYGITDWTYVKDGKLNYKETGG